MSNFPNELDDDTTLPRVDNNITEIGGDAINALRDAVFNVENNIGIGAAGSTPSISSRLGVSIDPAGHIIPSALVGIGLVSLPITDAQISPTAGIQETKLALAHTTTQLSNMIASANIDINTSLNFISNHGFKIEPHIDGTGYYHNMSAILVDNPLLTNRLGLLRNNTNLYTLFSDINSDLNAHENADGYGEDIDLLPTGYAHVASGVWLDTAQFSFVPQTINDVQLFANFIDNSNLFLLGTRIQNFYNNGVSRSSRSSTFTDPTHGQLIVPFTPADTYHLNGGSSSPVDNTVTGDDVIKIIPTDGYIFASQFALVKAGDIATVNYGNVIVSSIIKELRFDNINNIAYIRTETKNLLETSSAQVQINRSLYTTNKYGVLALSQAPSPVTGNPSSLIVGIPRGAEVLGLDFSPSSFDSAHYNLYLIVYPTGNPNISIQLPAIDVTGNAGATVGSYTLDNIVQATNAAFRKPGYNYRFTAFQYEGNLGLKLDPYQGATFSIVSGILNSNGTYNQSSTQSTYPNNVIDIFNGNDPLGFGSNNANLASPPYNGSPSTINAAQVSTRIFTPLTKKTYYVNGTEKERLITQPNQILDGYGDGYWEGFIASKNVLIDRVQVTYQVNQDLSNSGLAIGKTIVILSDNGTGAPNDFGRFIIENIQFNSCNCDGYSAYTLITVYDAVYGTGTTPFTTSNVGTVVRLYFGDDAISFNNENIFDSSPNQVFKRHFEIYVDQNGHSFSHERARMNVSGSTIVINTISLYSSTGCSFINIFKVSPKLRGYATSGLTKINLQILSLNPLTGNFDGYLCAFNGTNATHAGPITSGKIGSVVRFYDETNIDYIDFIFNVNDTIPPITSAKNIDIQLFPTLSLDQEVMFLGTCQLNDFASSNSDLTYLRDERQFGNISEDQLSTSALDYIAAPTRLLNENGVIRGFDIISVPTGVTPYPNTLSLNGGEAIVNGKIIQINNQTISIPVVQESIGSGVNNTIVWFVCANQNNQIELVASTDFYASNTLYTGYDHQRIFYVQNPNLGSPVAYAVRATYLVDLIKNQKDLVLVGIISVTVGAPSSTYVITSCTSTANADARRFVGNGFSGFTDPFTLGTEGSFRSLVSLNNWLIQLNNFVSATFSPDNINNTAEIGLGNKVLVKDEILVSQPITLDYANAVSFIGDGGGFTVSAQRGIILGNNVSFNGLKIEYTYDPVANADAGFDTTKLSNPFNGALYCNMRVVTEGHWTVTNGSVNASCFSSLLTPIVVGQNIIFSSQPWAIYTVTSFDGNATIKLDRAYSGTNSSTAILGYAGIKNVSITNCYFTSSLQQRYPFIVFSFGSSMAFAENVKIIGNRFDTTFNGNDKLAAIEFYKASGTFGGAILSVGSRMTNCFIEDNICNKDQLIIISADLNSGGSVINDMLVAVNVKVTRNVCGAINILTKSDYPLNISNTSLIQNKIEGIVVASNTCKFIYTGASNGSILDNNNTNRIIYDIISGSNVYTGTVQYIENVCSYMHVGYRHVGNRSIFSSIISNGYSPLIIKRNKFIASDIAFLTDYYNGIAQSVKIAFIEDKVIGS